LSRLFHEQTGISNLHQLQKIKYKVNKPFAKMTAYIYNVF